MAEGKTTDPFLKVNFVDHTFPQVIAVSLCTQALATSNR